MVEVTQYRRQNGEIRFRDWFYGLDPVVAARVAKVVTRMRQGNLGNVEAVGGGVSERKIDIGPGYRIYFGTRGGELILLLGGGDKSTQQADIELAKADWAEYKARKREEM